MRGTYILAIFISLFLHLVLIADLPVVKAGDVTVELSSSKSSFRVNLSRDRIIKKSASRKKSSVTKERRAESKESMAKSSVSVENKYVPKYPYKSRVFGEEGTVVVELIMDLNANILNSTIVKSSGYKRLDLAALDASKKSSFVIKKGGDVQSISHSLEFEFKLEK